MAAKARKASTLDPEALGRELGVLKPWEEMR